MALESLVHIYKQQSATFQKSAIFRDPKISQINADFKIQFNIILQPTSATEVDVHSELVYKTSWSCFESLHSFVKFSLAHTETELFSTLQWCSHRLNTANCTYCVHMHAATMFKPVRLP